MKKLSNNTAFWWIVVIVMWILMGIGLLSCNPAKRAANKLQWAYRHSPGMVARFARDSFPCIDKPVDSVIRFVPGKQDTVTDWQYIFLKDNDGKIDTVLAPCKCAEKAPDTVYYDINHRVLDSAAVDLERKRADSLSKVVAEISKAKKGAQKTNKVLWWVAGAGILGTVLMGFVGSKGGWIVALIKGIPKIIQLFKKK
ncbi:hypothetical protein [Niabella aurantiaca]|uniref:hypothetical protein n=1 Tax=Niabella aurantiaca TaxID=379900 RepID=UPI00036A96DB|nr:hypothetical protein [Niabella aurantiaca]